MAIETPCRGDLQMWFGKENLLTMNSKNFQLVFNSSCGQKYPVLSDGQFMISGWSVKTCSVQVTKLIVRNDNTPKSIKK